MQFKLKQCCWVNVCFLGFSFLSAFGESMMTVCCLFSWPVQMCILRECLLMLQTRKLDELGERIQEEKVFVTCWGWNQRGNGYHSRYSAIDLVIRLRWMDLKSSRKVEGLPSASYIGKSGPWVCRGWQLEVGPGILQQARGGQLRGWSVRSPGDMGRGKEY